MPDESLIPIGSQERVSRRFANRVSLFYGAIFGLLGTHLPFFPVWLRAVGIDAGWIGIIIAVPAVMRFTVLPFVTSIAERRHALRAVMILGAFTTLLGFCLVGSQHRAIPIFLAYVATCCLWTALAPLADAYALRGVVRYDLNYGRLRLWGSAAFIVGVLACGLLVDVIAASQLIWIIVAMAALATIAACGLQPIDTTKGRGALQHGDRALLRQLGFLVIILAAALIQGSHSAYYAFASIDWQNWGLGGVTIAGLWVLGVVAEIVVFALSPRFTLEPQALVIIGGLGAAARWMITAEQPPLALLAVVQLSHGLSFALTQIGTMGLLVRMVPDHVTARGQGYLAACSGIVSSCASILSGAIYAHYGQGVYYVMAVMAASGVILIWCARNRLRSHPQSAASGG